MKCPSCHEEIPDGKAFCGYCGAKIEHIEEPTEEVMLVTEPPAIAAEAEVAIQELAGSDGERTEIKAEPSEPPAKAVQVETTPDAGKRRQGLSAWAWILTGLGVVIIVVFLFFTLNPAARWCFELRDRISCEVNEYGGGPARADRSVTVGGTWWVADTQEQVEDYASATEITILLDNQEVWHGQPDWTEIFACGDYDANGDEDYCIDWKVDLGRIPSGDHRMKVIVSLNRQISDGFDDYGPGVLSEETSLITVFECNFNSLFKQWLD